MIIQDVFLQRFMKKSQIQFVNANLNNFKTEITYKKKSI